jgi:hypothetical protein
MQRRHLGGSRGAECILPSDEFKLDSILTGLRRQDAIATAGKMVALRF